ncbi:MAG: hypothetical protein HDR15_09295 [Lachnospiraceae bacterium]|nr:hypothetical protein [Lachnospiraceae bacterium]
MSKIKKMVLGIALAMCVFGGSVGTCYAASSSIEVDITTTRAHGKFVYGEAGHQIKVVVSYQERNNSTGYTSNGSISDTQNGNVTTAVASRSNPTGYRYTWGKAAGYVDGVETAKSASVSV